MREKQQAFTEYLTRNRLKLTPQRMIILDVFLNSEGHLTSEELYGLVKETDSSIGQATVYRTLKLFSECGIAEEVDFNEGVARYEHACGHGHHDHLVCERCRKTLEIVDERIEDLQERLAAKHGFELTGHKLCLYGLCPDCRKAD